MSEYRYNRMVIIGNGLDLALGLKTTYTDFLVDYLKSCVERARQETYQDTLFKIDRVSQIYTDSHNSLSSMQDWHKMLTHNRHWNFKYLGILETIMNNLSIENWVDIESLYFDTMIPMIDSVKKGRLNRRDFTHVKVLNESFGELSSQLDRYIKKVVGKKSIDRVIDEYFGFMINLVKKQGNARTCLNHGVRYEFLSDPENLLFLNFNYTDSIIKLIDRNVPTSRHEVINIHGQAGSKITPIIFGYGDDTHPRYQDLEQERSNIPLEFIKSFYYNRTIDYHEMLGFMESGPFEVYIVGHSCGLSDRTLLKSIFEHKDCLSIKIFHRGTIEEHIKKNMAISRHFDNKQLLRKRVLPFDKIAIIPQVK